MGQVANLPKIRQISNLPHVLTTNSEPGRSNMSRTPLGPVLVSLLSIVWLPAAAGEPAAGPAKTAAQAVAAQTTIDTPPVLIHFGWPPELCQPVRLTVRRPGGETDLTAARIYGAKLVAVTTTKSSQGVEIDLLVEPVEKQTSAMVDVEADGKTLVRREVTLQPVRKFVFYLLPHSHHDIGYTHLQTEVEKKQWDNIQSAMDLSERTVSYPPDSQFKWNTEVMWAMDSWLRETGRYTRRDLCERMIRQGQLELDALYGNELTGLCRPEELMRLCERSQEWARLLNVKVETAMISDVPGYTWGIVPVLAQAGVKYFSIGPNESDRLGRTNSAWADKPFYWIAPGPAPQGLVLGSLRRLFPGSPQTQSYRHRHGTSGRARTGGLPLRHRLFSLERRRRQRRARCHALRRGKRLERQVRLSQVDHRHRLGDVPGVRKAVRRQGSQLFTATSRPTGRTGPAPRLAKPRSTAPPPSGSCRPRRSGRWSAPQPYPAEKFSDALAQRGALRRTYLGAYNSIDEPDAPLVKAQWKIKQAFALDGDAQSKELLGAAFLDPSGRRADRRRGGRLQHVELAADRPGRARRRTRACWATW